MGTIADISTNLARWYGRRLRYLWTTSVNEGVGFFVVYTALVVMAAILGHDSILLRAADEKRLDDFLKSDHLVRDDHRFVSALSVVLSALPEDQRITQGACPLQSAECRRARNVLAASVQFATLISDRANSIQHMDHAQSANVAATDVATILSANNLPVETAAIVGRAVNSGVDSLNSPPTYSASVSACDADVGYPSVAESEKSRRDQFGLVDAVCQREAPDVSGLQIPEQVADFVRSHPGDEYLATKRIRRAIGVSFALEASLRASISQMNRIHSAECPCCSNTGKAAECAENKETHSFTAAYFVSVDSVLRYWRDETLDPVKSLPKNISWAARDYFTTYLRGNTRVDDEYISKPYIDIAGAGIVQTICRAVSTPISENETTPIISGVVCADLALRPSAVKSLVKIIQTGPLVSAGLLRVHADGEAFVEPEPHEGPREELVKLIESVQWGDAFTPQWTTGPASRGPTPLQVDSRIWYVVPIARTGSDVLAIALHPAPSSGVGRLSRWATLGSICGAALVLLTFTAHQSRRVAIAGRDLARLRGLPAAVIECRLDPAAPNSYSTQVIVAGNDRAEEVLQIQLPNFGLTDGAQPKLGSIFDEAALIAAGLDGVEPHRKIVDSSEIGVSRQRGDISTYYARLKDRRTVWQVPLKGQLPKQQAYRWVRMAAGPVILPRWRGTSLVARGRLESTLGIIVPVLDVELNNKLDDKMVSHESQSG
jgi:hypothetical protein